MRFELKIAAAVGLASIVSPAMAQENSYYDKAWAVAESVDANAKICHEKSGDEAIAGCTAAIQAGKLSGVGLAIVFYGRGFEYQGKENSAGALADYSEAIRLDRGNEGAYFNRGGIYYHQKDYARAIADYSEAIRVSPDDPLAYNARGYAQRLVGKVAEGNADIAHACSLDTKYCESSDR